MKKIKTTEDLEKVKEVLDFLLSHDYLSIELNYPGIGNYSLNLNQTIHTLIDIDSACAQIKGITKDQWIADDVKCFEETKMIDALMKEQDPDSKMYNVEEEFGNDRHKGKRFYPWFSPKTKHESNK